MAKKRYRLTPRRRAALKKAQAASARKRRGGGRLRRAGKTAGVIGGAVATTFVAYHTNRYITHPTHIPRDIKNAKKSLKSAQIRRNRKPPAAKNKQVQWHKFGYL